MKIYLILGLVGLWSMVSTGINYKLYKERNHWRAKYEKLQIEHTELKNQCMLDLERYKKQVGEILKRAYKPPRTIYIPRELPKEYKEPVDEQACKNMKYLVDRFVEDYTYESDKSKK